MKRSCTLLIAMLLVLATICGACQSQTPSTTTAPPASGTTKPAGTTATTPPPAEPAPREKTSLTVMVYDRGNMTNEYGTPVDNKWTRLIQEAMLAECNVEVKYHAVPRNEDTNQLNVLMAANTAPDIVFTYETAIWQNYAQMGGTADLGPSIEQYGANILANCAAVLPYGVFEGKQMAIHAQRSNVAQTGGFMRKDWADTLGITLNKNSYGYYAVTSDELYSIMEQFVEANLDAAPENQVWGTSGYGTTYYYILHLLESFYIQAEITEELSAVYPEFLFPGAKEGYRYVNQMYNDGLLYPDFALIAGQMDKTLFGEHITNGNIGVWFNDARYGVSASNGVYETLRANTPTAEVIAFDITNAAGDPTYKKRYPPTGFLIFVPTFSKNVDGAVMYLNWLADYANDRMLRYGFEGEHYQMINGVPTTIDVDYNAKTRIGVGDLALMYNGNPNKEEAAAASIVNLSEPDKIISAQSDEIALINSFVIPTFTTIIQSEMDYSVALSEKEGELRVKVIMCKPEEFDSTWDKLVSEYMSIGGQAVIDEKQSVWNEMHK